MTRPLTRRRMITLCAAALVPVPAGHAAASEWRGRALGVDARIVIAGLPPERARPLFRKIRREVTRIEAAFSLFEPASELSRLNATGVLANPSQAFRALCDLSTHVHAATGGAFDPTIQPLWTLYAKAARNGEWPDPMAVARVRTSVGWQKVERRDDLLRLSEPGMGLSFNGIAQGYAADRIAALMRGEGLGNLLIDMGEIAALGQAPGGRDWRAGIATPEGQLIQEVELADGWALATSSPGGTRLGAAGHIFDPASGLPARCHRLASVLSRSAALADALSTAACVMLPEDLQRAISCFPDTRLAAIV